MIAEPLFSVGYLMFHMKNTMTMTKKLYFQVLFLETLEMGEEQQTFISCRVDRQTRSNGNDIAFCNARKLRGIPHQ
jgi:hypothetical protein